MYRSSEFASSSILSFQELCTLSSDVCVDESTLCMALLQLQRDKQVTVFLQEGEKVKYTLALYKLFSHQDQNLLRDIFVFDCWYNVYFSVCVFFTDR